MMSKIFRTMLIIGGLSSCSKIMGRWEVSRIDSGGNVGKFVSMSLGKFGKIITYYDATNRDLKFSMISSKLVIDTTGDVGKYTSIKSSYFRKSREDIYISYYDVTNGNLKCAWKEELVDTFVLFTIDTLGNVGLYTSLELDIAGFPVISYYDMSNGDLKLAYLTDTGWSIQKVDTLGDVGKYNSISIDENNYIYISYYDSTNGDLKFATKRDGISWDIQRVDTTGDVGKYTSIKKLFSPNLFFISYYDVTNGDLKLAEYSSGDWVISSYDTVGDVGLFSNISPPFSSYCYVVYYNKTYGDLKTIEIDGSGSSTIDSTGDVGGWCSGVIYGSYYGVVYYDFTHGDLKIAEAGGGIEEGVMNNKLQMAKIKICPNPFIRSTMVSCPQLDNRGHQNIGIEIYDLTGRILEKVFLQVNESTQSSYSSGEIGKNLSPGVYFVKAKKYKPVKIIKIRR
jgi:hypothetical protein